MKYSVNRRYGYGGILLLAITAALVFGATMISAKVSGEETEDTAKQRPEGLDTPSWLLDELRKLPESPTRRVSQDPPPSLKKKLDALVEKHGPDAYGPRSAITGTDRPPRAGEAKVPGHPGPLLSVNDRGSFGGVTEEDERAWFNETSVEDIVEVFGYVDPDDVYNEGAEWTVYLEREIYLDNDDIVEFIVEPMDNGDVDLWVAFHDDGDWVTGVPSCALSVESDGDPFYYWLAIYPTGYDYGYQNAGTSMWKTDFCTDSTPSDHIDWLNGSSELEYTSLDADFSVTAQMWDEWVWDSGDTSHKPGDVFDYSHESGSFAHVDIAAWVTGSDEPTTQHSSFCNNC